MIEEIVVTARKREESLQETPVVVSALSARTISDFAIESVQDIADFTPGLISDGLGGVRLGLAVDAIYSDGYETSTGRQPNTRQDSYGKINAAVRLSSLDDAWSVATVGRNLADEYTFNNGGASPNTGFGTGTNAAVPADSIAYVARGRALTVEYEYDF